MPHTRLLAQNPAALLTHEHQWIRQLFLLHGQTDPRDSLAREALFAKIRHEIRVHGAIEHEHFYPAFSGEIASIPEDHTAIEGLLEKLSAMKANDKSYDALMKLLEENFVLHAAVEERDLFPKLRRLSPDVQYGLTLKMSTLRDDLERDGAF